VAVKIAWGFAFAYSVYFSGDSLNKLQQKKRDFKQICYAIHTTRGYSILVLLNFVRIGGWKLRILKRENVNFHGAKKC
jgi:hypothetical protein